MDAKRFAANAPVLMVAGVKAEPVVNKSLSSGWHGLGKGSRVIDGETVDTAIEYRETVIKSAGWEGAQEMRDEYVARVEAKHAAQDATSKAYAMRIARAAGLTAADLG